MNWIGDDTWGETYAFISFLYLLLALWDGLGRLILHLSAWRELWFCELPSIHALDLNF